MKIFHLCIFGLNFGSHPDQTLNTESPWGCLWVLLFR